MTEQKEPMRMYGKVGTAEVTICYPYNQPADTVEVTSLRPDVGYIVDGSGDWILDPQAGPKELARLAIAEKWPMSKQIAVFLEKDLGNPQAYTDMLQDMRDIRAKYHVE